MIDLPGAPPSPTPATGTACSKASSEADSGNETSFRSELNRELAATPPASTPSASTASASTPHADAPSSDAASGKTAARSQPDAGQSDADAKDAPPAGKQEALDPATPAAALALIQAAGAAPTKAQAANAATPAPDAPKDASGDPAVPTPPAALPSAADAANAPGAKSHGKRDAKDKQDPAPAGPALAFLHTPPAATHSRNAPSAASTPAATGSHAGVLPRALVPLGGHGSTQATPQASPDSAIAAALPAPTAVPGRPSGPAADKAHRLSRVVDVLPAAHTAASAVLLHASSTSNAPTAQSAPSAASQPPAATLNAAVGQPGWSDALGDRLVWMAGQHHQVAQLNLNPPDLGPLKITLTVHENHASAHFVSAHAAVRDAIENAMPRLRDMLAHSGITLGQANVSAEAFQQQAQPQSDAQGHAQAGAQARPDAVALVRPEARLRGSNSMVDIFA